MLWFWICVAEPAISLWLSETPAKPVKIYPIVKYGDPILEKPGALIKKFDAEMEQLVEDMFASMYAAQGVGLALFFVPLMSIVLSGLPPGRVASASGLANTLRTLAGSFATSLTTTWWDRREALHQRVRLADASADPRTIKPLHRPVLGSRSPSRPARQRAQLPRLPWTAPRTSPTNAPLGDAQ